MSITDLEIQALLDVIAWDTISPIDTGWPFGDNDASLTSDLKLGDARDVVGRPVPAIESAEALDAEFGLRPDL